MNKGKCDRQRREDRQQDVADSPDHVRHEHPAGIAVVACQGVRDERPQQRAEPDRSDEPGEPRGRKSQMTFSQHHEHGAAGTCCQGRQPLHEQQPRDEAVMKRIGQPGTRVGKVTRQATFRGGTDLASMGGDAQAGDHRRREHERGRVQRECRSRADKRDQPAHDRRS